jgi:hypothetical protein
MSFLFLGLLEKMLRQLRQSLRREMRRNRVILQLRAKFVADLLVDCIDHFLAGKHGILSLDWRSFSLSAGNRRDQCGTALRFWHALLKDFTLGGQKHIRIPVRCFGF